MPAYEFRVMGDRDWRKVVARTKTEAAVKVARCVCGEGWTLKPRPDGTFSVDAGLVIEVRERA